MLHAPEGHVDAALDLIVERGPAVQSLGFAMADIAEMGGVSRATVYQHWPTAAEANDDLARFGATALSGWQHRLLDSDPADDLDAALAIATGDPASDVGVFVRAAATSWDQDAPGRCELFAWEADWLEQLESWLRAWASHHGLRFDRPDGAHLAALGLTAMVDGTLLIIGCTTEGLFSGWRELLQPQLIAAAGRYVATFVTPDGARPAEPSRQRARAVTPAPIPLSTTSPAAASIIGQVWKTALAREDSTYVLPAAARMVDPGLLARRLAVSERTLYKAWPTAASFNGDLAERTSVRDFGMLIDSATELVDEVLAAGEDPDRRRQAATWALDRAVFRAQDAFPAKQALYAVAPASDRIAAQIASLEPRRDHPFFLAMVAALGRQLVPSLPVEVCFWHLVFFAAGLQRVALGHPELRPSTVADDGVELPVAGWLLHSLVASLSAPLGSPEAPT